MTSLQFGPEWMRKAPSKNPSSTSLTKDVSGASEANGHGSVAADSAPGAPTRLTMSKRQPSLGSLGAPLPVTAAPARSPGAFSFAAAAAAAGERTSGGGGTMAQAPSLATDDARYSRDRLLSLYSGEKGSSKTSDSIATATSEANGSAPTGPGSASAQKRKTLFPTDTLRRTAAAGESGGPLSPLLSTGGTEPRGLNSRGTVADKERSGGLFQRGGGGTGSNGPLVSPPLSRERFGGGIQGGVLSGVTPAPRRSKEAESPTESLRDEQGGWSRHGAASGPDALSSASSRLRNKAGEGGIGSLGNGGPELGISEAARLRLRQRSAGQGPIGPPADGSTGFTRRDRNAPSGYIDGGVASAPDVEQQEEETEAGDAQSHSNGTADDSTAILDALRLDDALQKAPESQDQRASLHQVGSEGLSQGSEPPKWFYRDQNGAEQGPFTCDVMHEWFSAGYFADKLPIRIETESSFEQLGAYMARMGNRATPFLAPYVPPVTSSIPGGNDLPNGPQGGPYNPLGGSNLFDNGIGQGFPASPFRGYGQEQPYGQGIGWGATSNSSWTGGVDLGLGFGGPKPGMSPSLFNTSSSPFVNPAFGNGSIPLDFQIRQQEEFAAMLRQRQLNDQGGLRGPGWDAPGVPNSWDHHHQQQLDSQQQQQHPHFRGEQNQPQQQSQAHLQQSVWHQEQAHLPSQLDQQSSWAASQTSLSASHDSPVRSVGVAEPIGTPRRLRSPAPAPAPETEATLEEATVPEAQSIPAPDSAPVEEPEAPAEKPKSPPPQPRTLVEAAAPEQLWPQSPSAVEFASEPSLPEVPPLTLSEERDASVRSRRKRAKGKVDSCDPSDTSAASTYGSVRVVAEDMARRGGPVSSTSTSVPITAWLPEQPSTPATPSSKPAPWAEEKLSNPASTLSLREIQEAEARQAETRRAAERAAMATQRKATVSSPLSKEALPTTMSWGLASQSSTAPKMASSPAISGPPSAVWNANTSAPKKTLTEIQEEEKLRAQRTRETAALAGVRKAYAESAARQAGGSPLSINTANGTDAGWSVVGATGKPSTPTTTAGSIGRAGVAQRSASAAASSPASVWNTAASRPNGTAAGTPTRSVSATVKPSKSVVADAANTQPSPEFLRYCREQLKGLNVKIDDFVEMLLSFPLEPSPDVVEIIAESVYANSSTLDGRRFAADFVAKRKMDVGIGGKAGGDFSSSLGGVSSGGAGWNKSAGGSAEARTASEVVKAAQSKAAAESFGGFKVVKKGGKRK